MKAAHPVPIEAIDRSSPAPSTAPMMTANMISRLEN